MPNMYGGYSMEELGEILKTISSAMANEETSEDHQNESSATVTMPIEEYDRMRETIKNNEEKLRIADLTIQTFESFFDRLHIPKELAARLGCDTPVSVEKGFDVERNKRRYSICFEVSIDDLPITVGPCCNWRERLFNNKKKGEK